MIDQSREAIKTWMNGNVLQNNIPSFPESVVENNGAQIFELLAFIAGSKNTTQFKAQIEKSMKRSERAMVLFKQYDDLLRFLKMEGAFLNHTRPQYLLSYGEYVSYIKQRPKEDK